MKGIECKELNWKEDKNTTDEIPRFIHVKENGIVTWLFVLMFMHVWMWRDEGKRR